MTEYYHTLLEKGGRLCHEAAAELRRLHVQAAQDEALLRQALDALAYMKRFIELEPAKIEPLWTAAGKGSYWWGVKIGLETALARLCEMEDQATNVELRCCQPHETEKER